MPGEGRKDDVKASVYMPRNEHVGYKIDASKDGSRISRYLLRLIRIGKAFLDYDLRDFLKVLRGEKLDREESEEIMALRRDLSPREFYERLLKMKLFCREGRWIIELREDVIDEKARKIQLL